MEKSGSSTASQKELDNQHRLELLRARLRVEPKKPILKRTPPRSARIGAAAAAAASGAPAQEPEWSSPRVRPAGAPDPPWAAAPPAGSMSACSSMPSAVGPQLVDVSIVQGAPLSADFEQQGRASRRRLSPAVAGSDVGGGGGGGGIGADTQLIGSCPSPLPHSLAGTQARRNHRASVDAASCAEFLTTRMASATGPLDPTAAPPAHHSPPDNDAATSSMDGGWTFTPDPHRARMQARNAVLEAEADVRYVEPKYDSGGDGGGGSGGGGGSSAKASAWKRFVALAARAFSGGSSGGAVAPADGNGPDVGEAEEPLPVVRSTDSAMVHRKRMGLDGRPKRLVRAGPVGRSDGERTTHPGDESEVDCMDAEVTAAAEAFTAAASAASATGRGFLTGAGGAAAAEGGAGRTCSSSDSSSSDGWEEERDFTPIGTAHGAVSVQDEDDERAAWAAAAVASAPLPMSAHVYRMDSAVAPLALSGEAQLSSKSSRSASSSVPGRGRSFRVRSAAPDRS